MYGVKRTEFTKTKRELQKELGMENDDPEEFDRTVNNLIINGWIIWENGYCLTPEAVKEVEKWEKK